MSDDQHLGLDGPAGDADDPARSDHPDLQSNKEEEPQECDDDVLESVPRDTDDITLTHSKIKSVAKLQLDRFPELETLCLRQNLLTEMEPELSSLTGLTSLDLYDNRITRIANVAALQRLTSLDLSFNKLRSIEGLETLTALRELYLVQNYISKIENLDQLVQLRVLELGANQIRRIENLGALVHLEQLWLGKNKIAALEGLETLASLRILSVQSNRLRKLENLDGLAQLEELYVSHNGIERLENLTALSRLSTLDVTQNRLLRLEGLEAQVELEEFWASGNQFDSFADVERELAHGKPQLHTVYLENTPLQRGNDAAYRVKLKTLIPSLTQIDAVLIKPSA